MRKEYKNRSESPLVNDPVRYTDTLSIYPSINSDTWNVIQKILETASIGELAKEFNKMGYVYFSQSLKLVMEFEEIGSYKSDFWENPNLEVEALDIFLKEL